jgi:hypothetical protein
VFLIFIFSFVPAYAYLEPLSNADYTIIGKAKLERSIRSFEADFSFSAALLDLVIMTFHPRLCATDSIYIQRAFGI